MSPTTLSSTSFDPADCFPVSSTFINEADRNKPISFKGKQEYIIHCCTDPILLHKYPFLPDLIKIEEALLKLKLKPHSTTTPSTQIIVNPELELVSVGYSGLEKLFNKQQFSFVKEQSVLFVYRPPGTRGIKVAKAHPHDLLCLKIITEALDYREVAKEAGTTLGQIDDIVYAGTQKGILISPPSGIQRGKQFEAGCVKDPSFFSSKVFTLQWHITQKCDLHCRHCYDRSQRREMMLEEGIKVLDDLYAFCQEKFVYGQVTFTGGNPLLYPEFLELYKEAADRGFLTAILGNPAPRERMEKILNIRKPQFYQVSLEGMRAHNDYIRGENHFNRVVSFLQLLKELNIYSMVMLTLTRANQNQVLELAEFLRDKVDRFNFNRLSMVGEGAALASVDIETYRDFLKEYLQAAKDNPIMGLKDNFFNLLQQQNNKTEFYGGCAGHGCGAAFNFVSLLPDGRVDACRKFDSPMGNIFEKSLSEIYHSSQGERYRNGPSACDNCDINAACRGCMAVAYGMGKDVFTDVDPYCFK